MSSRVRGEGDDEEEEVGCGDGDGAGWEEDDEARMESVALVGSEKGRVAR